MKTFEYNSTKQMWKVTTDAGEAYMSYLSPIQIYEKEVNELHNLLLDDLLKRKNYLSLGEVALWLDDESYGKEASQIIQWFKNSYQLIITHLETIEDYQDPQGFISTLPILN
jgi:hypothetical protein